jgi:hypothetical protein
MKAEGFAVRPYAHESQVGLDYAWCTGGLDGIPSGDYNGLPCYQCPAEWMLFQSGDGATAIDQPFKSDDESRNAGGRRSGANASAKHGDELRVTPVSATSGDGAGAADGAEPPPATPLATYANSSWGSAELVDQVVARGESGIK